MDLETSLLPYLAASDRYNIPVCISQSHHKLNFHYGHIVFQHLSIIKLKFCSPLVYSSAFFSYISLVSCGNWEKSFNAAMISYRCHVLDLKKQFVSKLFVDAITCRSFKIKTRHLSRNYLKSHRINEARDMFVKIDLFTFFNQIADMWNIEETRQCNMNKMDQRHHKRPNEANFNCSFCKPIGGTHKTSALSMYCIVCG